MKRIGILLAGWLLAGAAFGVQRGVPGLDPDYSKDVRAWWAAHPFNPGAPRYDPVIQSPAPVVDVAQAHARNPKSDTAGILEALALLPSNGGTLWFPKQHGVYEVTRNPTNAPNRYRGNARIQILRRSNLHFLSDGATIRGGAALRISSQEFADHRTEQKPVSNFYFRNFTFDLAGDANFLSAEGARDMVFDDCRFVRAGTTTTNYGPGMLYCISKSDNWWFRNCEFGPGGNWALHPDGSRGYGVLNCRFLGEMRAALTMFTNDDVDRRWGGYLVVVGNTFAGLYRNDVLGMAAGQVLVAGNVVTGKAPVFVRCDGKQSAFKHQYDYRGIWIVGNDLSGVKTILRIQGAQDIYTPYTIGQYTVLGNRAKGLEKPVFEEVRVPAHGIEGPNVAADNGPNVSPACFWTNGPVRKAP